MVRSHLWMKPMALIRQLANRCEWTDPPSEWRVENSGHIRRHMHIPHRHLLLRKSHEQTRQAHIAWHDYRRLTQHHTPDQMSRFLAEYQQQHHKFDHELHEPILIVHTVATDSEAHATFLYTIENDLIEQIVHVSQYQRMRWDESPL